MGCCLSIQLRMPALGAVGVQLSVRTLRVLCKLSDPRASICWSSVQLAGRCLGASLVWLLRGPARLWLAPTATSLLQGCLIGVPFAACFEPVAAASVQVRHS